MTPEQRAADRCPECDGDVAVRDGSCFCASCGTRFGWRPKAYKRYSPNGVVRLYSLIDGEWLLVAKRLGAGPWSGVPNARARREALAELRGLRAAP